MGTQSGSEAHTVNGGVQKQLEGRLSFRCSFYATLLAPHGYLMFCPEGLSDHKVRVRAVLDQQDKKLNRCHKSLIQAQDAVGS